MVGLVNAAAALDRGTIQQGHSASRAGWPTE